MFRLMKILTFLLLLFMTFSLIGCSSTSVNSKGEASAVSKVDKQTKEDVKKTEVQDSSAQQTTDKVTETNAALTKPNQTIEKVAENKTNTTKTEETKKDTSTGGTDTSTNKTTATKEKPKAVSSATTVKETSETKKQIVPKNTVFMKIKGPKDVGTILAKSPIEFKEGDTVLDVLLKAAKEHHFQVEYSGSGAMAYIEGIDNSYEFDYGPTSGWNFKQNGTEMGKSSGTVKVKKDDQIEWIYTEDFTENK